MPRPTKGNLEDVCRAAAGLASIGWRAGETALDLTGDCLKAVRSGAFMLVAGGFLHNGPLILCDVDASEALKVGSGWLKYDARDRSGVVEIEGRSYITHGDARVVYIHNTGRENTSGESGGEGRLRVGRSRDTGAGDGGDDRQTREVRDIDSIGNIIANRLSLSYVEAATIGSRFAGTTDIDYVSTIEAGDGERYQIIIPCTIGEAVSIGAPRGVAVPSVLDWYKVRSEEDVWYEVAGYVPVEHARFEPGWVAQHVESGTSVIIRHEYPQGEA